MMSSPSTRRSSDLSTAHEDVHSFHLSDEAETAAEQEALNRVLTCSTTHSIARRLSQISLSCEKQLFIGYEKPLPPTVGCSGDFAVEFDGPDDPSHPRNWPVFKKWYISLTLGFATLTVTFASAEYAAATTQIMEEFNLSLIPALLGVSLFVAGFAAGPILWGSLSEYYGRRLPLLCSSFMFTCLSFMVATAKDAQTLLICRFFSGLMGAAPVAVVPGAFTDLMTPEYRGTALAMFINLVMAGPTLSPIVGSYVSYSYLGWRWTQYICGIMGALSFALLYLLYDETYYAIVLIHKARKLRQETGNWAVHAVAERYEFDFGPLLWLSIKRPIGLIFTQPIVLCSGLYGAFTYGILYLALTGFPLIYEGHYKMSPTTAQLPYIGMFLGLVLGTIYLCAFEAKFRRMTRAGKKIPPHYRLYPMILSGFALPVGLFILFWTGFNGPRVPWIAPVIGECIIGFAMIGIFLCLTTYTVECFLAVAASVTAALAFMRAAFACATPLFTHQMFNSMGIQWAGTLLGCVAVAMSPIPILFVLYADKLKR